jgi:prophage regulatory protein
MNTILRLAKVLDVMGMSRSTLYLRIRQGLMTPPVKLGERSAAWPEHEVSAINAARISQKSEEEIRELVARLYRRRVEMVC